MRWKLLRRRLSISAPRVSVRSHLPWPLRWAVLALALGFSAALALWAFETGRDIAGLDRDAQRELETLRREVAQLRGERDKAQAIANSAESVLKMEQVAQERLAQQLRVAEIENQELKNDLGFFERLLPAAGEAGPAIRALQVEDTGEGRLRYQLLVMQPGKSPVEFNGRYDLTLVGLRAGQPWSELAAGAPWPLKLRQYRRVDGVIALPGDVVLQSVQVRLLDQRGTVRATQTAAP
jgi:hypothetical protein